MSKSSDQNGGRVRILPITTPDTGAEPPDLTPRIVVMANGTGKEEADLEQLEDRDLVKDLSPDTFDQVMEETAPGVEMDVPNVIGGPGAGQLHVSLVFSALEQFDPASVARTVPEMRTELRKRERLNEWRAKLANKPKLAAELRRYLKNRNRPSPNGTAKKKES